jgi:two-component system, chemotaxis family, sensor kinase CheA
MELDELFEAFIMEGRELLVGMEASLLLLETKPDDTDVVNAIFRAVHTIKGSSGMLGLEAIITFCHHLENVLDLVRDGKLEIDNELIVLLFSCRDYLVILVEQIAIDVSGQQESAMLSTGVLLLDRLKVYALPVKPVNDVQSDYWHISLRFGHGVLRYGIDPLLIVHNLDSLGNIIHIHTLSDALPFTQDVNAQSCYVGFEIDFLGENIDKARIEKVFAFVREDCTLRILPPQSRMEEYIQLLGELPEDQLRLGELLVSCGALTRKELNEALHLQAQCAEISLEVGRNDKPLCQLGDILVEQRLVHPELIDAALVKQKSVKENKALESTLIRIQSAKLDYLIGLVGQMVSVNETHSLLVQQTQDASLISSSFILSNLVEEIRNSATQLRMVQIGETFNRFNRVVRDLSREIGKDVGLSISGAEIELDKSVVDKIGESLMHLVRNSVAHGIEEAELRMQRGKPAKGMVHLDAYHDSGCIVIEVRDDGGGLNREVILAKALEKGLVTSNQALSDQDIFDFVFVAGFTTAKTVSTISGRGIGMDAVRHNIENLQGRVKIDSREGVGSTIRIHLPLTMVMVDGFLIKVDSAS